MVDGELSPPVTFEFPEVGGENLTLTIVPPE